MNRYRAIFVTLVVVLGAIMFPAYSALPSFDSLPTADDTVARRRAFDYYYLQSLALKEQGSHDAALEMLEHCLSIDPDAPAVLFELSNYYMYLGKKTEALALMQRAVKEEPGKNFVEGFLGITKEKYFAKRKNAVNSASVRSYIRRKICNKDSFSFCPIKRIPSRPRRDLSYRRSSRSPRHKRNWCRSRSWWLFSFP